MKGFDVSRTATIIKHNTLPESHFGKWFFNKYELQFRIKPAVDKNIIMLEVCPIIIILDRDANLEMYRFQTGITFSFSGNHSRAYIIDLATQLTNVAIDEFNIELNKVKCTLTLNKNFVKTTKKEIEGSIISALDSNNYQKASVVPYWKRNSDKTIEQNQEIIDDLPIIPSCKDFTDSITNEQRALNNYANNISNEKDINIIRDCLLFYPQCFEMLKQINLEILNESQFKVLNIYMNKVLNAHPIIFNDLTVSIIHRVTVISRDFLDEGKLRKPKYLSYPPLEVNQKRGVYNRANSPEKTLFYGSEFENVAIRETKPEAGKKIIITKWLNTSSTTLKYYPICLTAGISNHFSDKATYAFELMREKMKPLYSEWMENFFSFFASEFIKESRQRHPKRYEYFFSAFFADRLLQPFPKGSNLQGYECIVYSSVAWNHIPNNLAILPKVIDNKFRIIEAIEYEVIETWYDKKLDMKEYPARLRIIRKALSFGNDEIKWDDD